LAAAAEARPRTADERDPRRARRGHRLIYLDASALVKAVVEERESGALRRLLAERERQATSVIAAVEVPRAVERAGGGESGRLSVADALASVTLLDLTEPIRERAAGIPPSS